MRICFRVGTKAVRSYTKTELINIFMSSDIVYNLKGKDPCRDRIIHDMDLFQSCYLINIHDPNVMN